MYFRIENDIDLGYYVAPYGIPDTPIPEFSGYLDGNGKTISNLYIQEDSPYNGIGLFTKNSGTIKNLNVQGIVAALGNNNYVGMIAGFNTGTIQDCTVTGYYVVYTSYPSSYAGGITAINYSNGVILNCTVNGNVYSTGGKGPFAALNYGTVILSTHNGQLLP